MTIIECSKEVKVSDGVIKKLILDQVLFIDDENKKQYKKIIKENIPQ